MSITLWRRCEASSFTNTGAGHPRQPVLRHIFSLDPLMSLPAWVIAGTSELRDVEGCSGSRYREFSRSSGRRVQEVKKERNFQTQTRSTSVLKWQPSSHLAHSKRALYFYITSHIYIILPPVMLQPVSFPVTLCATIMQRWRASSLRLF